MRELVIATVGAIMLIALGLAALDATDQQRADAAVASDQAADGMAVGVALRLAD